MMDWKSGGGGFWKGGNSGSSGLFLFWVVLFFFILYPLVLAFFRLCGWGMDGRMEEGSVSAGMVAYGFLLLVEKACIDCRRLILFSLQYTRVLRAVRSGYRTFVAKKFDIACFG